MNKIPEKSCLAKETQTHRYGLLAGIIMCGLGFVIFLNFSLNDFLTSGFTVRGILIDTQIPSQESVSSTLHIDEIKRPVTLIISNPNSPVAFDIRIENALGITVYNANVIKPIVSFVPDISGDYMVFIKNLSGKDTTLNVSYGYLRNSENISLFSILWEFLIIGGNYLIIHSYFSGARNQSYFTH